MSTNPFQSAIAAGLATRRAVAGVAITYDDGANPPVADATGVQGKPDVSVGDALLAGISKQVVDWMIPVADLASLDMPPKEGHTITHNGTTYTATRFEGQPVWAYVDAGETEYRIHTTVTDRA